MDKVIELLLFYFSLQVIKEKSLVVNTHLALLDPLIGFQAAGVLYVALQPCRFLRRQQFRPSWKTASGRRSRVRAGLLNHEPRLRNQPQLGKAEC